MNASYCSLADIRRSSPPFPPPPPSSILLSLSHVPFLSSSPPSSLHSPSSLSFIPAVTCTSLLPPPSFSQYFFCFPPAPHVLRLNLFTLISHLCCAPHISNFPLSWLVLIFHHFYLLLFSYDIAFTELAIVPLPPFLFYIYFLSVSPLLHPHRHSSLISVELSHCFSCVCVCLCVCLCVCRWEIIWKLKARLGSEAASAFIPCSVAMTITRPQPTKAANEKMAGHFLISNGKWLKEALDNYTQREENRQTETERDRDKERGIPSLQMQRSLQSNYQENPVCCCYEWVNVG